MIREDFPEPETPVTHGKRPQGNLHVDVFQVVLGDAPRISQKLAVALAAGLGHFDTFCLPLRYWPVMEPSQAFNLLGRAGADHLAAVDPGPRADVHNEVGGAHGVLVVLHHNAAVLPRSRRFFKVASSLSLSRWCRPMEGSSRIYSTPIREEPIWVARRMRWLSPPDKVPERPGQGQVLQPHALQKAQPGIGSPLKCGRQSSAPGRSAPGRPQTPAPR